METGKSLLGSKAFWLNALGGGAQVIGYLTGFVPETWAPVLAGVQALLNILVRYYGTQQPITSVIPAPVAKP